MGPQLPGKVAIITGGGKGQGRAASLLFASEGAKVVVADWDGESAEKTAQDIKDSSGEAIAVKVDVSNEDDVKKMIKAATDAFGRIDVLFNNAGIGYSEKARFKMAGVVDTPVEDWDAIMAINLKGEALGCKHAIPIMVEQGGGVIVNSASINALVSLPGADAYTASKGGIVALTRVLADVYGPMGIRVNCICPGSTMTSMLGEGGMDPNNPRFDRWKANCPLRRPGTAEELANVALFLASDVSSYVTGVILPVDGGYTTR
jgi:meso-butanediol dehydrogenase / (S,S)-butanediol dehydrogenase / diacetyl reductase